MAYDGFISYSHAADGELAPALQDALQRLAKPWYRRRSLEVFRDETGLSVDPHLWGAIVTALEDAEWFVLLTSPQAAASEWVNKEIEHWKDHRPLDRILPVVTEGHWEWDPTTGDFTEDSTAVPPALRGVFTDEPRHLDLRWAREETQLDLRHGKFRDSVAEVAAPLHGRTKDDLEGEDIRQHRRTIRLAWGAAVALIVLTMAAVMGAGIAVRNADEAEARRIEADAQRLVAQSQTELPQPDLAFLLAAQADRLEPSIDTRGAVLAALATRPEFRERLRFDEGVTASAISGADDLLVTGSAGGDVTLTTVSTGEQSATADGLFNNEVVDVAIVDNGGETSVIATDGVVLVTLDTALEPTLTRSPPDPIFSMDVNDTGDIAAGTGEGDLVVWTGDEADPTAQFRALPEDIELPIVTAVAWTTDGDVVIAGQDGTVRRYDPDRPARPSWQLDDATTGGYVAALEMLPDGRFVTGGTDGSVGFWDVTEGVATTETRRVAHGGFVTDLAYTGSAPDEGSVASVAEDGRIIYWNDLSGAVAFDLDPPRVHQGVAATVAWDPEHPLTGVTGGADGTALIIQYGADTRLPLGEVLPGFPDPAAVALSPDGARLAVATTDGRLMVTTLEDPDPDGPSVSIDAIAEQLLFTPDGRHVLAGLGDGRIVVWDGDGRAAFTDAHDGAISQLAVAPDGETVASNAVPLDSVEVTDSTVQLWTLERGRLRPTGDFTAPATGFGMSFFDDGNKLAMGGVGAFAVHDFDRAETTEVDIGVNRVSAVDVDPAGELIAVAFGDGRVQMYATEDLEPVGDPLVHPGPAEEVAFYENGELLITLGDDGGLRFWRVDAGRPLAPAIVAHRPQGGLPPAAAMSLAGDVLVTGSLTEGRIIEWPLAMSDWIKNGCEVHDRDLTDDEARRFDLEGAPPTCGG